PFLSCVCGTLAVDHGASEMLPNTVNVHQASLLHPAQIRLHLRTRTARWPTATAISVNGSRVDTTTPRILGDETTVCLSERWRGGLKCVTQHKHAPRTEGGVDAVEEYRFGRWWHMMHSDGRDHRIERPGEDGLANIALTQLQARFERGKFGARPGGHLFGQVV